MSARVDSVAGVQPSVATKSRTNSQFRWVWLAILVVAGFSAYHAGLRISYFSDDFQYMHVAPDYNVFYFFTHSNPFNPEFYRPLNSAVLILVQHFFGWATWP